MNDMQAIIIEGAPFPWKEVHDEIDRNNLWERRPEHAAAISDPGICSCPRCRRHYWAEGTRQECPDCHAQYETDWWAMLSWGVQHARILANPKHPMHRYHRSSYMQPHYERSSVFGWGMAHPDCSLDFRAVFKATDWIEVWAGRADYIREGAMVGGKVIGIARGDGSTLLHVKEMRSESECRVRCIEPEGVTIELDDQVWWQAGKVYWTPRRKGRSLETVEDVPLVKVGYSH